MKIEVKISAAAGYGRTIEILANGESLDYDKIRALCDVNYDYCLVDKALMHECALFSRENGACVKVEFKTPSPYTFETAGDILNAIFCRLDEINQAFYEKYPAIYDHANEDYRFVPRRNPRR